MMSHLGFGGHCFKDNLLWGRVAWWSRPAWFFLSLPPLPFRFGWTSEQERTCTADQEEKLGVGGRVDVECSSPPGHQYWQSNLHNYLPLTASLLPQETLLPTLWWETSENTCIYWVHVYFSFSNRSRHETCMSLTTGQYFGWGSREMVLPHSTTGYFGQPTPH